MLLLGRERRGLPEDAERLLETMTSSMARRGPDDRGTWMHPDRLAGLCHSRLSIVDLSTRGHQPMTYAGNDLVIAFNGEIYNFRQLRQELSEFGYEFHSDTDTEVVLAAVHRWGIEDALSRFVGMFAFALWDERKRVLYLARDRLGEKPLFISSNGGILYFASELRTLLTVPGLRNGLDMQSVWSYLKLGYVCEPRSMIDGIYKLPAAHYLAIEYGDLRALNIDVRCVHSGRSGSDRLVPKSYWSLAGVAGTHAKISDGGLDASLEHLDRMLRNTVRDQMQCDVPYGAFLSGGIDSSIVAAYMQSESDHPVHTYTVRFDDAGFDEGEHAARIAGHLGTEHHELWLSESQIVSRVPLLSAGLDEPTANASVYAARMISELARESVTVCFSGDGGDEAFAGYNRYLLMSSIWHKVKHLPGPARKMAAAMLSLPQRGFWDWLEKLRSVNGSHSGQSSYYRQAAKFRRILDSANVVQAYEKLVSLWQQPSTVLAVEASMDLCWPECGDSSGLDELVEWDLMTYLPGDNLAKLDRASMAASLEMRLPLLDHRIIEFGYSLPAEYKINNGKSKWLLKQLLYRRIPEAIMERPKMGFTAPVERWLGGPLKEWAMDFMVDSSLARDGYLDAGEIDRKMDAFTTRGEGSGELWSLAVLHAWYQDLQA